MTKKEFTFEQSMERLSAIVDRLESGETPMEESLKLFEEGAALVSSCQKQLNAAEQKVLKLRKGADGEPVEAPFEEDDQ